MKKYYKWIIIVLVLIVVALLGLFIYKNLFEQGVSERLEGIENYNLTKKEIKAVKEKFNEIEELDSVDINTNYKIIKIFIKLKEDVDFEHVKDISNEALEIFSEEDLSYYDVEIFVDSLNEESEVYPKIGYKHKINTKFTWNR